MPPPYNSQQKAAIAQFVSFTSQKDSVGAKYLKQSGWNVEAAIDSFFQSNTGSRAPTTSSSTLSNLKKLFDKYRDDPSMPDQIGVEGAMQYLTDVGISLEEVAMVSIFELFQSPEQGQIERDGFVNAWKDLACDTIAKQTHHIEHSIRRPLKSNTDPDLFRRTYRYAFILARANPQQKVLPHEVALEFWKLLFNPASGGLPWSTPTTPWSDWWLEFVEETYKRGVNRDLWDQLLAFARKTLEQEDLGFWSEEAAWPGAIDEFVAFVKGKRGVSGGGEGDEMEEDED